VNERIEEVEAQLGDGADKASPLRVVCECALPTCTGLLEVSRAEYEAVRANPERFLVLPGHEELRIERLVEQHAGFFVVEKVGQESAVAVEHDPRE
jgi:hypothetical protein